MELELKGVVPDPAATRGKLLSSGLIKGARGMLRDRRYDRQGEFTARDEVVRVRAFTRENGTTQFTVGWKGPTQRSPEGLKQREEREFDVDAGDPSSFLSALGFEANHSIDRYVEYYYLKDLKGSARLEWYPRMDVLVEVEGTPDQIETVIAAMGLPRDSFTAEALTAFTARYDAAHPHAPSLVALDGWEGPAR